MQFDIQATDGEARAGKLTFTNTTGPRPDALLGSAGSDASCITIETPIFMPVGTQATVKAISQEDLEEIGFRLILGNTYHLYLRPGADVIHDAGGIHNFMSWPFAVLTDSGGYQAFSLSDNVKLADHGVIFRSHLDGSEHLFSPENTVEIQRNIGSDIMMPIDDCAPYPADEKRLKESLVRTHRWLAECKEHWLKDPRHQVLFGISQGGVNPQLRAESARAVADIDLPGYAIGGLSVGEPLEHFVPSLGAAIEHLPKEKPRYVMGVGTIPEILNGVALGVDMYDCVLPTRNARNGQVFTSAGKVNLRNLKHARSDDAMDSECGCKVCKKYSLGYIRHLHKQNEILGLMLSTYHNLYFMHGFMKNMRNAIQAGRFAEYRAHWLGVFTA
ncbi:MAG: tRNA guanosine(34) transglycosylase Tgt [Turneriella sp.]